MRGKSSVPRAVTGQASKPSKATLGEWRLILGPLPGRCIPPDTRLPVRGSPGPGAIGGGEERTKAKHDGAFEEAESLLPNDSLPATLASGGWKPRAECVQDLYARWRKQAQVSAKGTARTALTVSPSQTTPCGPLQPDRREQDSGEPGLSRECPESFLISAGTF